MRKRDLILSLILLAVVIATLVETAKLPVGSLSSPHVGFFPLIIAILLGTLSLILLGQAIKRKDAEKIPPLAGYRGWKPFGLTLGVLFLFAIFFERLGYLISTFLLIAFLARMSGKKKWRVVLMYGFIATLATYLIFDVFLKAPLP
jgi:putative tricarboxylic transport membrane protein